ncbi:MAG: DUF3482 domain-containing protein, partial [Spartobacteria bacterium]|nr:DUF3482 domain-containing protein [Spartobacteria bacterium]
MNNILPRYAVMGHPNEGKSSVVSTLAENDRIAISNIPGETQACHTYPVMLDGQRILEFIDTPGFQMPRQTLKWMQAYHGDPTRIVAAFIDAHRDDARFLHDSRLLAPLSEGAGIIYVLDANKPLRRDDLAEMEILRLTGLPRMAVINSKDNDSVHLPEWKQALNKSFNTIRQFNAHNADFDERIRLLETLKAIEQDWEPALDTVIRALKQNRADRMEESAEHITRMLKRIITLQCARTCTQRESQDTVRHELVETYRRKAAAEEEAAHTQIKKLFQHHVFNPKLETGDIMEADLFSKETWSALGLTRKQLALAGAAAGAALGAAADFALAQITFGVFMTAGALAGGIGGYAGTRPLSRLEIHVGPFSGELGGRRITVGPMKNPQLMFILVDRALLYIRHVSNRAHALRADSAAPIDPAGPSLTAQWTEKQRATLARFYSATVAHRHEKAAQLQPEVIAILKNALD